MEAHSRCMHVSACRGEQCTNMRAQPFIGRCHRLGQTVAVTCTWLQAFAVDVQMDELIQKKQCAIDMLLPDRGRGCLEAAWAREGTRREAARSAVTTAAADDAKLNFGCDGTKATADARRGEEDEADAPSAGGMAQELYLRMIGLQ